tara:strand:- start:1471 stop:1692 length:222 start_codon:yes stop_codon:yes gene_type:complete
MAIKTKLIGLILIIVGALPFLIKIDAISTAIDTYGFLEALVPGSIIYQAIIIILGIALFLRLRPNVSVGASKH